MILTSNPHDYVGVNSAPDALLDRVLTLEIEEPSPATLTGIVARRSGLDLPMANCIVRLVCAVRQARPAVPLASMRTAILIARIAAYAERDGALPDPVLAGIAADVLAGRGAALPAEELAGLLASFPSSPEI